MCTHTRMPPCLDFNLNNRTDAIQFGHHLNLVHQHIFIIKKNPIFPYQGTQQHIPILPQLLVAMSNRKIKVVIIIIILMNCIFPKKRVCLRGEIK